MSSAQQYSHSAAVGCWVFLASKVILEKDCKELQVEDESCQHHKGRIPSASQETVGLHLHTFQIKSRVQVSRCCTLIQSKSDHLFPFLVQPSSIVETLNIEISGRGMLTIGFQLTPITFSL